jgi:hypothetical protein
MLPYEWWGSWRANARLKWLIALTAKDVEKIQNIRILLSQFMVLYLLS